MKKITVENLVVGQEYYVECGIWKGNVTFCGSEIVGKRIKYRFTFGTFDNWKEQFGFFQTKSNLKIYERGVKNA